VNRILIIVQNLSVPFDRRVWRECQALLSAGYEVSVVCPKGTGDPAYAVVDSVRLYKYRPYAPGGMDDDQTRARLGKLGRARVEQELASSHQERAYLEVYRRVLDGSRALAPAGG
jgi:hypothetical protein